MHQSSGPTLTVVSRSFPPFASGSAILLANLLASYPGQVNAIAGRSPQSKSDATFHPPCDVVYPRFANTFPRLYTSLRRRFPERMSRITLRSLRRAFRHMGTNVVLAAYPYDDLMVAAFLAAQDLHLPFYAHMHDLWAENTTAGSMAAQFAAQWEPIILRSATRVLCMTQTMQEHYARKYGIEPELLPHCIAEQDAVHAPTGIRPPQLPQPSVLFVGAVSPAMNLDALQTLAAASELLPPDYQLLYCTAADLDTLGRMGITSSRLRATYVSRAEVQRLQSAAHVLIAPLSHKNCATDEVRTVFSTKLLEYLISGRPIIVFAPEGSFQAESASKNGWAHVVTADSPEALAQAIVTVTTDDVLAGKLVNAALRECQARQAKYHAEQLWQWVLTDTQHVHTVRTLHTAAIRPA